MRPLSYVIYSDFHCSIGKKRKECKKQQMMTLAAVTLKEIEKIFEILDRLGISREAVVIPLEPEHPGHVKRLANGKLEITVESEEPFDTWLAKLEEMIKAACA